jgi:hypothetical protein
MSKRITGPDGDGGRRSWASADWPSLRILLSQTLPADLGLGEPPNQLADHECSYEPLRVGEYGGTVAGGNGNPVFATWCAVVARWHDPGRHHN